MIIFKKSSELSKFIEDQRLERRSVGFAPTMGALHQGHLSLISRSKSATDITVCSIFVNPTQFNDPLDFEKYPITIDQDVAKLLGAECDVLFLPTVAEIYPAGTTATAHYDLGDLENKLEGAFRPGHFQGVCQVMERLLQIVQPDKLFLGQKDFQQQLVLKKLVQLLYMPVDVQTVVTTREASGLAMSSRNMRLSPEQKEQAAALYQALIFIKQNFATTPFTELENRATETLLQHGFDKVEYIQIVDAESLQPMTRWDGMHHLAVLAAAFIGGVRLIDNLVLTA